MTKKAKSITPPLSDEAFEQSLKASALKQAQKDLNAGRASSQTMNTILTMSSRKEELLIEQLELKNELLRAQIASEQAAERIEELVMGVHDALKRYSGAY